MVSRDINIWKSLDWWTILLYAMLVFLGMISIYAASYDFDNARIFDLDERSGKQLLWITLSFGLAFILIMIEYRLYETLAIPLYLFMMGLLLLTIFVAEDTKGSRSWINLGFMKLQPAEFAKFATALAVASLMNSYNFKLLKPINFLKVCALIILPILLILMQKETGSALVYGALVLVLYREGMSGMVLFGGLCAIVFFVVGIKYGAVLWGVTPVGEFSVLCLILLVIIGMLRVYYKDKKMARNIAIITTASGLICYALYLASDIVFNYNYLAFGLLGLSILYMVLVYMRTKIRRLLVIVFFPIVFGAFLFSVNYVFDSILEPHQQVRIRVALGMEDDPRGAGYNVNQSKIAIGSGGLFGKGFLNGTQTKLKYVPEQDTDFIFCTIGEEFGFLGSTTVLLLFLALIWRIIFIAERQRTTFGRVYGYCVASIFLFHVAINIGMVIGLCPVIGIPLPFFSYGGSSLWGFSILLFILLRIDLDRLDRY